jgi:hypothetical protein
MPSRQLFQEWRQSNDVTNYPFAAEATLTAQDGSILLQGSMQDAALYPIGGQAGLYLSQVVIDHQSVQIFIGDPTNKTLASGTFKLIVPPDEIVLTDTYNRPAGILVSESKRLGIFQSWGVGTHVFDQAASEFAATVCMPTPQIGVRGIQLEDGSLFTGDVWLIGDQGVVLRTEDITLPASCGQQAQAFKAIRVDIVGDPLFRRRLCSPTLFETPQPLQKIRVKHPLGVFECTPDVFGDIKLTANNNLAADTVLRIRTTPQGVVMEAVGSLPNALK